MQSSNLSHLDHNLSLRCTKQDTLFVKNERLNWVAHVKMTLVGVHDPHPVTTSSSWCNWSSIHCMPFVKSNISTPWNLKISMNLAESTSRLCTQWIAQFCNKNLFVHQSHTVQSKYFIKYLHHILACDSIVILASQSSRNNQHSLLLQNCTDMEPASSPETQHHFQEIQNSMESRKWERSSIKKETKHMQLLIFPSNWLLKRS